MNPAMHARRTGRPSRNYRPTAFGAITMLALSVAMACAGESADSSDTAAVQTSTAAPSVTNACTLVPATEVSAVIGETVRDSLALNLTDASGAVSLSQCNYASATNAAAASLMLRKSAVSENVAGALQSIRETIVSSGVTAEDVTGLGDGALWGGNQLHVISNKGWSIVVSPPPAGGLPQARALAERALSRL